MTCSFPHPPHAAFFHQDVNTLSRTLLSLGHIDSLLVVDELPKSVSGNHQKLVCGRVELVFGEFRIRNNTSSMGDRITKGSELYE